MHPPWLARTARPVCTGNVCQAPACSDTVRNGGESGVDCGGTSSCGKCSDGERCDGAADCASGVCAGNTCQAPACNDGLKNGAETGLDCGGVLCAPCAQGLDCNTNTDCASGLNCNGGRCFPSSCVCAADSDCPAGKYCFGGSECLTVGQAPAGWSCSSQQVCGDGHTYCFCAANGCQLVCHKSSGACGFSYGCNYRVD